MVERFVTYCATASSVNFSNSVEYQIIVTNSLLNIYNVKYGY